MINQFTDHTILGIELSLLRTPVTTTKLCRHLGMWKVRLFSRSKSYLSFDNKRTGYFLTSDSSPFCEDISLFNTTLRFALTGEVATISNGTITQARITNLNRSRVSNIVLDIPYHISLHDKDNLQLYTGKVQQYIDSYPNIYDGINCFQCEAIDTNLESVTYRLSVRCRVSWQNAKRVFVHRSNLHRQCIAIAHEMKVDYTTPDPQNIMYYGGSLPDGTTVNGSIAKKGGDFVEVMNLPREIGTARNDVLGS